MTRRDYVWLVLIAVVVSAFLVWVSSMVAAQ